MKLNLKRGLDRVWAFASMLWIALIILVFFASDDTSSAKNDFRTVVGILVVPPFILFIFVRGVAWIVRGFAREES